VRKPMEVQYEFINNDFDRQAMWLHNATKDKDGVISSMGTVIVDVGKTWWEAQNYVDEMWDDIASFLHTLDYYTLSERICLELEDEGYEHSCEPRCMVEYVTFMMLYPDKWENLRVDYKT